VPPKRPLTCSELHGVICQVIVLFTLEEGYLVPSCDISETGNLHSQLGENLKSHVYILPDSVYKDLSDFDKVSKFILLYFSIPLHWDIIIFCTLVFRLKCNNMNLNFKRH
jgi:hypothetical protein